MKILSSEKAVWVAAKSTRSRPTQSQAKTHPIKVCAEGVVINTIVAKRTAPLGRTLEKLQKAKSFRESLSNEKDKGQYSAGRNVSSAQQMDNDDTTDGNEFFVGVTNTPGKPPKNNSWTVNLSIEGKPVTVQIDTGAQCTNVMSQKTYSTFSKERSGASIRIQIWGGGGGHT
ncbi:hypothetical protein HOLleu_44799 [Holothuria leucospilota]|uniref:Uncharacterized protein n=1 Tax=Holothuria leucospilota TaxID=206669 RepID=A0A9Q1BAP4_HOLLE|nr:hypothetical protein HOLleu_44799 [Holothuria leucospilota]